MVRRNTSQATATSLLSEQTLLGSSLILVHLSRAKSALTKMPEREYGDTSTCHNPERQPLTDNRRHGSERDHAVHIQLCT